MARDARAVAKYFLDVAKRNKKGLTHLQVMKLVYIAHGWKMGISGVDNPLITQYVEAWDYGPVIPRLYQDLKKYGADEIINYEPEVSPLSDEDDIALVEWVYKTYGDMNGIKLSNLTHMPGTPWANAPKQMFNENISNEEIASHYENLYAQFHEQ